jgi:hypothetical protein
MKNIQFKFLKVGAKFEFSSARLYRGLASGPWIKISTRKYKSYDCRNLVCEVGSIKARVDKLR